LDSALSAACSEVGIMVPKRSIVGRWTRADTYSGRNGRGDGEVFAGKWAGVAKNWQAGRKATVSLIDGELTAAQREERRREERQAAEDARAARKYAAAVATSIVGAARLGEHPYLIGKGFASER